MSYSTPSRAHDRDLSSVTFVRSFPVCLFTPCTDTTGTKRIRVDERILQQTTPCGKRNCVTCPFINTERIIVANSTGAKFGIANNAVLDCNAKGIIYLIECRKCRFQYVGLTKQSLKKRLSGHKYLINNGGQTLLARHYTSVDHDISDLTIRVLQIVGEEKLKLHDTEDFWIRALNTAHPLGLNEKVRGCHGLVDAKVYDGTTGTPFLQIKGARRPRPRGKRTPFKAATHSNDIIAQAREAPRNPRVILRLLREQRQPTLRILRKALANDKRDLILATIAAFTSGLITSRIRPKRPDPKITVIAQYVNHGLGTVLFDNLFHHRELITHLPDVREIGVRIAYKREIPFGRTICNHTTVLKALTMDKVAEHIRRPCDCADSPYIYTAHGHVITGDLSIVRDSRLRTLMGYGSKYRIPVEVDLDKVAEQTHSILAQFIKKYKGAYRCNLNAYCEQFRRIIDNRINRYHSATSNFLAPSKITSIARTLQQNYVIAPADKASNNLVIICKKFYLMTMCREMGVDIDRNGNITVTGNDVYEPTTHTLDTLTTLHTNIAARYHTIIGLDNSVIPLISAIPKLHKVPYKMRFLAGARLSTVKNVSIIAHKVLKCMYAVFRNYCKVISGRGTRPNTFWSINNSSAAINCLQRPEQITDLATFDFSTLFTALSHNDIKNNLNWLIAKMFKGPGNGQILVIGRDKAYFTKERKEVAYVMDEMEVKLLMEDVIDNAFVTFAGKMFRQTKGVPMGGNCSPMMADLCLTVMEHRYIMSAPTSVQYGLRYVVRYIDDILVANFGAFHNIAKEIYPTELILKRADDPVDNRVAFLDLHIARQTPLCIDLYDKTRDFNFRVVKFAHMSSNVPRNSTYQIFFSQLVRIARITNQKDTWLDRTRELVEACRQIGAIDTRLANTFGQFSGRHQNLLWQYGIYTDADRHGMMVDAFL